MMSVKTGHKQESLQERGDLADLFASAVTLIRGDKRNELQRRNLRQALQLFLDNRLAGVIGGTTGKLPDDMQSLLSLPIASVLRPRAATYMGDLGIEFVGELFLTPNDVWRNPSVTKSGQEVRQLITDWGIPFDLDLEEVGWVPPYANDPKVLEAWSKRSHELGPGRTFVDNYDPSRWLCSVDGGCETVGEKLRRSPRPWYWQRYPHWLQRLNELGLHLVMYVPKTWTAPPRDPATCHTCGRVHWEGQLITMRLKDELAKCGFNALQDLTSVSKWDLLKKLGADRSSADIQLLTEMMGKHGLTFLPSTSDEKLEEPIVDMLLSVRTVNCLRNADIVTLGDLLQVTEAEFLCFPNFGRKSLNEVKELLHLRGYALGMLKQLT